jgi:ABC-type antimicrobial peptide transport system permease subunit
MVVRQALTLAAIGIAGGLLGARAATGVLTGLLYGVRPTDPSAFALTAAIVGTVALAACYVPVRRAIRVDPVRLLR